MTRQELAAEIADHGGWEEWHQRRAMDPQSRSDRHWTMYDHHKAQRLRLEAEYRRASSRETTIQTWLPELRLPESEGDK